MREILISPRQFIVNKVNNRTDFTHWVDKVLAGRYVIGVENIATLHPGVAYSSLHVVIETALTSNPPHLGIGGWQDPGGAYYLDYVLGLNSLETALRLGKDHGQECIWDSLEEKIIWI